MVIDYPADAVAAHADAAAVALGIPLITRNENDFRGIHSALAIIAV